MKLVEKLAKDYCSSLSCKETRLIELGFIGGFYAARNLCIRSMLSGPLYLIAERIRNLGEEEVNDLKEKLNE